MSLLQTILVLADWSILDNDDGIHYQSESAQGLTTKEQFERAKSSLFQYLDTPGLIQERVDLMIAITFYDITEGDLYTKESAQAFLTK